MECRRDIVLAVTLSLLLLVAIFVFEAGAKNQTKNPDDCDKCGPTRLIGCRSGRCYYKCTRRCLGKDNKFYYEALKFNFAGQR